MDKRGLIFALFTALVSGFSIFINKFGVKETDPYVFTGVKNIIVALFLLSALFLLKDYKELLRLDRKQWAKLFLIGLIGGSIPFLLFFKGLSITSAASGSFIQKTMFVFVAIGAITLLKEKVDRKFMIAAVLLLIGNALLLNFSFSSFAFNYGDLLILAATLFWAAENLLSKHTLKEVSSRTVAFGRMFFGSLIIIMFWAVTGRIDSALSLTGPQFAWIGLTAAFLFIYVTGWYYALQRLKASTATAILLIGSPITTALNYAFLGTAVTVSQAFGMLMIVGGIILAIGLSNIHIIFKHVIPSKS